MSQDLTFFEQQDTARLLGVIAALGGEVFVLKAQVERLTRALSAAGLVDEALLSGTSASAEMQRWMSEEEKKFGRTLMRPFVHLDEAVNVSAFMAER